MNRITISLTVNGTAYEFDVDPGERLVDLLRERLGLTGTKVGCGEGECGGCTINLNGKAVLSCLIPAVKAAGGEIVTIEGLAKNGGLHPLQQAFVDEAAIQCGYCTPGMIMAAHALLQENPDPTEGEVREHLANNLCRCTGYEQPIQAVLKAARIMKGGAR